MSADIIAWLRSEEGEEWSRSQSRYNPGFAPDMRKTGPGDPAEDPTDCPPIKGPALIAAREAG